MVVINNVGKVVIVAVPAPICRVAPAATCKVPDPLPVIWFPPSAKVPAFTVRFPAIVIAAEAVFTLFPDNVRCPYVDGPTLVTLPATVMALVEL